MTLPGIALFLLLAQNAGPQQPPVPASIAGVIVKAGTGESLSKVTVTLTEVRIAASATSGDRSTLNAPDVITLLSAAGVQTTALSSTGLLALQGGLARQTMTTSSDGKFLFENVKPGTYSLTSTSPGYAPAEYGQRGPSGRGINITLKPGQKMPGAAITMTPEGTITGRVVDANGDPLNRALVQALKVVYQEKGRSLITVQAVPTDDKGEYRLFWLPSGQYYISATPTDDRMRTMPVVLPSSNGSGSATRLLNPANAINTVLENGAVPITGVVPGMNISSRTLSNGDAIEEAAVAVYYPAAYDTSKATLIEVRPGGITSGIDIATSPSRVYRVRGTVVSGSTGQPVSLGGITLLQRNGPTVPQPVSVLQGTAIANFEIAGVVPGSYFLVATGVDTGRAATGIASIEVGSTNLDNVIIPMTSASKISGRVVNAATNTAARQAFIVRLDPQTSGLPTNSAPVTMDGVFTFNNVLPGDYRVLLSAPTGIVPKSIRYDGVDVLTEGLHFRGPSNAVMEIDVTDKGGRLEGNVVGDRQTRVANATVVLMPTVALRAQTNLFQTVQTNAEGHFTIENITPGNYRVFAWDEIEDRAWFDAEVMRNFENRGRDIVIGEGAREVLDLTVISQ